MIDRETLRELRREIDALLLPVGKARGLSIKLGNATYNIDGKSGQFKLEITAEGVSVTEENLKKVYPEYVGKLFETPQGRYRITGLSPRGTSFLISRVIDGRQFTMKVSAVQFYLKKAANA